MPGCLEETAFRRACPFHPCESRPSPVTLAWARYPCVPLTLLGSWTNVELGPASQLGWACGKLQLPEAGGLVPWGCQASLRADSPRTQYRTVSKASGAVCQLPQKEPQGGACTCFTSVVGAATRTCSGCALRRPTGCHDG